MLMGDENSADLPPIYIRLLQPQQKGVSAAPVHQEIPPALLQDKAGIIARRNHGVAGSQHSKFHVVFTPFLQGFPPPSWCKRCKNAIPRRSAFIRRNPARHSASK